MRYKIAVLTLFLAVVSVSAASQDVSKPNTQAQCKFADGTEITLTYSPEGRSYRLSTNDALITVRGLTVPAGDYTVVRGWERYGHFLILQKETKMRDSSQLPRIRMSATTLSAPEKKDQVGFVSTGRSCTMQMSAENSSMLLSVEFTKKNADLPVLQ